MAFNTKLIYCETKDLFLKQLDAEQITDTSIVFIKSTGELWTHGKLFAGNFVSKDSNKIALTLGGSSVELSKAGHTHSYLPLSGGTLTGALNFANNTWNKLGDDAYIGDHNVGNHLCIKAISGTTAGIAFFNSSDGAIGKLASANNTLQWNGTNISLSNHNHDDRYVNITGDTMTGVLTLGESSGIKGTSTSNMKIGLYTPQNIYLQTPGTLYYSPKAGTDHRIWHAGNDGSGSGMDADLLDGRLASSFVYINGILPVSTDLNDTTTPGYYKIQATSTDKNPNLPSGAYLYGMLIVVTYPSDTEHRILQLYYEHKANGFWRRMRNGSTWLAWSYIPCATDNVASASKVKVILNITTNTNYPIVWSNQNNTNTSVSNLYKSWDHLYYNPSTHKLTSGGFIKAGSSDSYLLLGGGGHTALSGLGSSHSHTVFKNNVMIKGTNGMSDSASIHLGIGDSDTGFKWISDGVCQMYANNVAIGQWNRSGMNWLKQPFVNSQKIWHAGNDGSGSGLDADLLDGCHAFGTSGNVLRKRGQSVASSPAAWCRLAKYSISSLDNLTDVSFLLHSAYNGRFCILNIESRAGDYVRGRIVLSYSMDTSKIRIYYDDTKKNVELYYLAGEGYSVIIAELIYSTERNGAWNNAITMYNSDVTKPSYTNYINPTISYLQNPVAKLGTSTVGGATTPIYLNGGSPTACSTSTSGTANTIAVLNGSGDLTCRLVRSTYANLTAISGALAFRVNNSNDNYIRFCSDTAAIRTWLGAASSSHNHDSAYLKVGDSATVGNNSKYLSFANDSGGIGGVIGTNDQWRIYGRSTATNAGYLEIATSDDGNEPIYFRLYTGVFTTLKRTLTLLDGSGNTSLPGNLSCGWINDALHIEGRNSNDTTVISGKGHSFVFGDIAWYAHVNYVFRPNYGSGGPTQANLVILNASAAASNPTYTTTHSFSSTGIGYHSKGLGVAREASGSGVYTNTIYASDWFRSEGGTGWFNQTYGGGINMTDSTWVRVYGGKAFVCESTIETHYMFSSNQGVNVYGALGSSWNNGLGAFQVKIPNNNSQTPILLAYNGTNNNNTGSDRYFAIEVLNLNNHEVHFSVGGLTTAILTTNRFEVINYIKSRDYIDCAKIGYNPTDSHSGMPWYGLGYHGDNWMALSGYAGIDFYTAYSTSSPVAYIGTDGYIHGNLSGNASSADLAIVAEYFSTHYAGGVLTNPLRYFSNNMGLKVAMTGVGGMGSHWTDTLWINGYSGGDVKGMCALHFSRQNGPRFSISYQNFDSSSYGTCYEVWTSYNFNPSSVVSDNIKWAMYKVTIGSSSVSYSKMSGNHNFISGSSRLGTGRAVLSLSYPSGASKTSIMMSATGHHKESGWDYPIYASLQPDYGSSNQIKLMLADDPSLNDGEAIITFMYVG